MMYYVIETSIAAKVTVLNQVMLHAMYSVDIPLSVPECLDYLDTKCPKRGYNTVSSVYTNQTTRRTRTNQTTACIIRNLSRLQKRANQKTANKSLQNSKYLSFGEKSQSKDSLQTFAEENQSKDH